jgi:SET domain-containing protein
MTRRTYRASGDCPTRLDVLIVRRSAINGRGLYAKVALPARRKLGELSGELVRVPAAWADYEKRPKLYIVQVTPRLALECSNGNAFKYLNHSCAANCYLRIIDRRVEVYARTAIAAGSELTVDYGETPHAGGMRCRCGAPQCRGRL